MTADEDEALLDDLERRGLLRRGARAGEPIPADLLESGPTPPGVAVRPHVSRAALEARLAAWEPIIRAALALRHPRAEPRPGDRRAAGGAQAVRGRRP